VVVNIVVCRALPSNDRKQQQKNGILYAVRLIVK
jgi:hypothetical protein